VTLLGMIENYLKRTGTPPTRFGREAVGDPRLVGDLRRGRQVGRRLEAKLMSFVARPGQR